MDVLIYVKVHIVKNIGTNDCWNKIYQVVRESKLKKWDGKSPNDDVMESLLGGNDDYVLYLQAKALGYKVTYKYTYSEGREKYLEFKSIQNKNLRILYSLEPVLNKYVYIIKELDNQISQYDRIEDALTYIGHYCKP